MKVRIGTRGSKLALVQTEYVKQRLEKAYPEDEYEIVIIKTKGDKIHERWQNLLYFAIIPFSVLGVAVASPMAMKNVRKLFTT